MTQSQGGPQSVLERDRCFSLFFLTSTKTAFTTNELLTGMKRTSHGHRSSAKTASKRSVGLRIDAAASEPSSAIFLPNATCHKSGASIAECPHGSTKCVSSLHPCCLVLLPSSQVGLLSESRDPRAEHNDRRHSLTGKKREKDDPVSTAALIPTHQGL